MFTPTDNTNEYAVVGSILIEPKCLANALAIIDEADFDNRYCRAFIKAAKQLRDEGNPIDAVLLANRASKIDEGVTYDFAAECMRIVGSVANIEEYCQLVKEAAVKRQLTQLADDIQDEVYNQSESAAIIAKLRGKTEELSVNNTAGILSPQDIADAWLTHDKTVKADPEAAYIKTGFKALDSVLGGGMFNQGFYIIAARPGMGKTTIGIGIAENIAERGKSVLFISLEMSRVQIMAKRISRKGRLSYTDLMTGRVIGHDYQHALDVQEVLADKPFMLSDASLCRVSDIENMAHGIKDLKCIVVDYFGLLTSEEGSGVRSRYEECTEISKRLKSLAKRLNIPLLVLCQLNRENATRGDKHPTLSDLRDTGALEQDADAVVLLHREEYYKAKGNDYEPPEIETIELNVAKNRHGNTACVSMAWEGEYGIISEICPTNDFRNIEEGELPF